MNLYSIPFVGKYDGCYDGGLFSDRVAAERVLYSLRSAFGRAVCGPTGQSTKGPGASPDASCREEVLLLAQAEQLTARVSNR